MESRPAAGGALSDRTRPGTSGAVADNRADRIGSRTDARSDLAGSRGENRDFLSDNRQDRMENRGDLRSDRIENRGDLRTNRVERRHEVGQDIRNGYWENHPRLDFWKDHPDWARWRYNRPYRWATWAAVTSWFPWGWGSGIYYDYGSGGNVYYDDGSVYVGQQAYPAEQYTESVAAVADSAPEVDPNAAEWMPLGVFALTNESGADPTMFLQLAVSKEGVIAGTYHNSSTDATQQLEGMVDKSSQRAVWRVVDQERPVMETGVYNLTEEETSALVHFPDGQIQQWLMVRLEDPDAEAQSGQPAPGGN
jgi:hypothetical protein